MPLSIEEEVLNPKFGVVISKTVTCRSWTDTQTNLQGAGSRTCHYGKGHDARCARLLLQFWRRILETCIELAKECIQTLKWSQCRPHSPPNVPQKTPRSPKSNTCPFASPILQKVKCALLTFLVINQFWKSKKIAVRLQKCEIQIFLFFSRNLNIQFDFFEI